MADTGKARVCVVKAESYDIEKMLKGLTYHFLYLLVPTEAGHRMPAVTPVIIGGA